MTNETVKKNQIEDKTGERLAVVETKIDMMNKAIIELTARIADLSRDLTNGKASKNELADLEKRLKVLEDERSWVVRVILGVLLTAILGTIIVTTQG
jgi:uncharacterized coiled-coil DUF342 family protein